MHATCKRHGILFVDDEVQAGMARTGRMWAMEHHGVAPDVMCSAKALGSGIPIGATVFRKELDWGKKGSHSNTYGGNAIACASALATIDTIEKEGLVKQAESKGEHLRKRLSEMKQKYEVIGDVRGLGLMQAVEFVEDRRTKVPASKERDAIEELCFKRGLVAIGCGKSGIRLIPPLNIATELLDVGLEVFEGAIRDVNREMGR
jgi:4-aminobutyrate aminotransferase